MQAGSFEKSATQFHRTGRVTWPKRSAAERRKPPTRGKPDRQRSAVSAKRLCMAAKIEAFGRMRIAAGQERKPDAGASAGDETLMRKLRDASRMTPIER